MSGIEAYLSAHPWLAVALWPVAGAVVTTIVRLLGQTERPWARVLAALLTDVWAALSHALPPAPPAAPGGRR